jgi:hypothetical protein
MGNYFASEDRGKPKLRSLSPPMHLLGPTTSLHGTHPPGVELEPLDLPVPPPHTNGVRASTARPPEQSASDLPPPLPTPRPMPPHQASPVPALPHGQIPAALYGRIGLRGQSSSSSGRRRAGLLFLLPGHHARRSPPPALDLLCPSLFLLPRPPRRQSLPPPAAAAPPIFSSSPARGSELAGRSVLSCRDSLPLRTVPTVVGDGVKCLLPPLLYTLCKGAFASPKCTVLLDSV